MSAHVDRMARLDKALRENSYFLRGLPFLFIFGHWNLKDMLGEELMKTLGRRNVILATTDQSSPWATEKFRKILEQGVIVPYVPHSMAHETDPWMPLQRRREGYMFHGDVGRWDFGLRDKMLASMRLAAKNQKVRIDIRVGEMTRGNQTSLQSSFSQARYMESAYPYLNASLCMSPSGDTITTRRLFDALEAGCVPVLVWSWYSMTWDHVNFYTALPFPHSINWQSLALRFGPCPRAARQQHQIRQTIDDKWLAKWHGAEFVLEKMRDRGRRAFRDHLDYVHNPQGVAKAMLREIRHILASKVDQRW